MPGSGYGVGVIEEWLVLVGGCAGVAGAVRAGLDAVLDVVAGVAEPAGGGGRPQRRAGDRDRDRRGPDAQAPGNAGDADGALRRCGRRRPAALVGATRAEGAERPLCRP